MTGQKAYEIVRGAVGVGKHLDVYHQNLAFFSARVPGLCVKRGYCYQVFYWTTKTGKLKIQVTLFSSNGGDELVTFSADILIVAQAEAVSWVQKQGE